MKAYFGMWLTLLIALTLFFDLEQRPHAFRHLSNNNLIHKNTYVANSNSKIYINKSNNNDAEANETKPFEFFTSWQSGIGSKLERDFKLTEKVTDFIGRRTGKSITGLVDAISSIESPLTAPKGKGGAKLVGNLDATSTKKRIIKKKRAESAQQQALNTVSLLNSLKTLPSQLQYDFERRTRARNSAEAVSSPQLLLPDINESDSDEDDEEEEEEEEEGDRINDLRNQPAATIKPGFIDIDIEATGLNSRGTYGSDSVNQSMESGATAAPFTVSAAKSVIDIDSGDIRLVTDPDTTTTAGSFESTTVMEPKVRLQKEAVESEYISTSTSTTTATATSTIEVEDTNEEVSKTTSTKIINSNSDLNSNLVIDSEASVVSSASQQKSLSESALLAADLVFFLAEKLVNAVGPVISGTTGNILEQAANNLRLGEPSQSELVNDWLKKDSKVGVNDGTGVDKDGTQKNTGLMLVDERKEPLVPKQRWKSVMRVEPPRPINKSK